MYCSHSHFADEETETDGNAVTRPDHMATKWQSQGPISASLALEPLGPCVLRHSVTTSHEWLLSTEDMAIVTEEPNFKLNSMFVLMAACGQWRLCQTVQL